MTPTTSPGSWRSFSNGVAGAALLDSYEAERKPVARFTVEQAYTRYVTRTATYLGAKDYQPIVHDFNIELGTIYHSRAILEDGEDRDKIHDDPRATRGRPGARAPHLWVESAGARRSTLDLFGRDVVLLAGAAGAAWCTAAERAARSYAGLALKAYCVGGPHLRDPDGRFGDAYDLGPAGACLVRPDGIVAWRAKADGPDREATIARALDALLARA